MEATSSSSSLLNGLNSGVVLSLIAVLWTVVWQNLQRLQLQTLVGRHMNRHARRLAALVDPYLSVTIHEYEGGRMKRSAAYEEVKAYLSASSARDVRHLRAEGAKDADKLVLSMVDGEEVSDVVAADDSTDVTVWCKDGGAPPKPDMKKDASSKVTLSGLLNFIDGLWSACGGERLIVFTTNHVKKLDPALIRRGRMDKHIEMSYCCFEAFKFLAKTYLDVDSHRLFAAVDELLSEVDMTPADVAENLTPKSLDDNADTCLAALVKELEKAKENKSKGKNAHGEDKDEDEDEEDDDVEVVGKDKVASRHWRLAGVVASFSFFLVHVAYDHSNRLSFFKKIIFIVE
ncbi:hypothetical protein OsJ_12995 [Oryza sativa Japonica Group]|uniref:ATPase AAA-type core domain-containing protein n=1 Tax=Oryza sativa subsp. japonica TaxID=39947 RepID=B9F6I9_ORYSJ|nr:hypothetical protein OsJ_12995 [Oryza sativa Japonica Group]